MVRLYPKNRRTPGYHFFRTDSSTDEYYMFDDWVKTKGGEVIYFEDNHHRLCIEFEDDEDAVVYKLKYVT